MRKWAMSDEEFAMVEKILGRTSKLHRNWIILSYVVRTLFSIKIQNQYLRKFPTTGEQVLQGPGEGAGIVDIGDNQAVVFKIESHITTHQQLSLIKVQQQVSAALFVMFSQWALVRLLC